jgi:hypothetical protein
VSVPSTAENPIIGLPRTGSALKVDIPNPIYDAEGNLIQEFPAGPQVHGFPDIVDNYASQATPSQLRPGVTLYQLEGSSNGVSGRFEWIVDNGNVTHRMFVPGGTLNGVPIEP